MHLVSLGFPAFVMSSRFQQQRPTARRPRRRAPRWGALAVFAGLACVAACTLTQDDFAPSTFEAQTLTPDAGGPSAPCAGGVECCDAVPCSGAALCLAGVCAPPQAASPDAGVCVGSDCSPPPVQLQPSCDDRVQNGDETGVDCGGGCEQRCSVEAACQQDLDCDPGTFCASDTSRCTPESCTDTRTDGAETGVDCGGDACPPCNVGLPCNVGSDCVTGACNAQGTCAPPSCNDSVRNGLETGVDCGGNCLRPCDTGAGCVVAQDCASQVCEADGCPPGVGPCCQAPACDDQRRNGSESGVDCGNQACGACPLGGGCFLGTQCQSGFCQQGVCADPGTCNDFQQNGDESSPDCGGTRCGVCPDLRTCNADSDCFNNNCDNRGICISCGDNVLDGTETGVDCGGADPFCRRCNPGERCLINSDCTTNFCNNGFC